MLEKNIRRTIIYTFIGISVSLAVLLIYPYISGKYWVSSSNVFEFDNITGPVSQSTVAKAQIAEWQNYAHGDSSRLSILLTDTDSAWLGLVHGLKTIGVPFRITTQVDEALNHNVVLVYPLISGKVLTSNQLRQIADYARTGGNLIGVNVLGGGLQSIFGFKSVEASRRHHKLQLQNVHSITDELINEGFDTIRLSTEKIEDLSFGTHIYHAPKHPPLARYDDGTPGMVFNKFKTGHSYAIGFDIGFYLLKAYNRRMENVAETYANGFEASVDNTLRLIKAIYQRHEAQAVTLGTVPFNRSLSVILTHDIDYNRSLENALVYAQHEYENKTSGTHFIQTKYIQDWNDEIFFNEKNIGVLRQLQKLKVELASHSVSHSRIFHKFELGDGTERYPEYKPFVLDKKTTYNGSILGELRISKFLIEKFSPGNNVISFRPGYLSNPLALPQSLQATGYQYSSSVTANVSLSHLPFQLNYDRDNYSQVPIFEFPITVEDELPPKMGDRVNRAIDLAHKIRRYGGIFVVLIHPDIIGHKFEFQTRFVEAMKPYAWFGSLQQFGDWWSARDKINIDVKRTQTKYHVLLSIPERIKGLVLNVPANWRLLKSDSTDILARQEENYIVLDNVQGSIELVFK